MKISAGDRTKEKILDAALEFWPEINVSKVAEKINMTRHSIYYHFSHDSFKDEVAQHALKKNDSKVILQMIATDHPIVADLSPCKRAEYFKEFV